MARWWFLRVLSNSSSFSWILRSISWRTCPSSSWARRTLFSSCSKAASASSRAAWSSSFSTSKRLRCLSSSWMERPPSPSWSRRSLISSARFLFSLLTTSNCSTVSSQAAFSQKECRNYNSELFRLKAAWDETVEQLDVVKRENKNLADEIKDLLDQLGDGGRSIHELDKQRRR